MIDAATTLQGWGMRRVVKFFRVAWDEYVDWVVHDPLRRHPAVPLLWVVAIVAVVTAVTS